MQETIKKLADILLHDQSSWGEKYEVLQAMHTIFVRVGAVNAFVPDAKEDDIWLENGCAVSPKSAAMCLFEVQRTQQFVAGLKAAITNRLAATTKRPIHILDAGAGPYAIFALLTAGYFTAEEVQYTVMDIHPENIASIKILVNYFHLQHYFLDILLQDAISYQSPANQQPDIIITETMKNALHKETQMAITLNLNKQLATGGIFIPEEITLSLQQIDLKKRKKALYTTTVQETSEQEENGDVHINYEEFEKDLGTILTLSKNTRAAEINQHPICTITVPEDFLTDSHCLSICTSIKVYENFTLSRNETSITFALAISTPTTPLINPGQQIDFWYENGANPGIKFNIK